MSSKPTTATPQPAPRPNSSVSHTANPTSQVVGGDRLPGAVVRAVRPQALPGGNLERPQSSHGPIARSQTPHNPVARPQAPVSRGGRPQALPGGGIRIRPLSLPRDVQEQERAPDIEVADEIESGPSTTR